jgi:hypothetical protein
MYKQKQVEELTGIRYNKIRYYREQGVVIPTPVQHGQKIHFEYTDEDVVKLATIHKILGWVGGLNTAMWLYDNYRDDIVAHGVLFAVRKLLDMQEQEKVEGISLYPR